MSALLGAVCAIDPAVVPAHVAGLAAWHGGDALGWARSMLGGHLAGAPHHGTHFETRLRDYLRRVDIPAIAVIESLAGAACYAISSVLQQTAAAKQPAELAMRPGLLWRLARSGRWMFGNACDVGGFVFQFLALRRAALALVQPLFVFGLVLSIVGAAIAEHRRPTRGEWGFSVVVMAGLALFIVTARPGPGFPRGSDRGWVILGAVTVAVVGATVAAARGGPRRRALSLGVGTGVLYGVTAAVTERTGHELQHGWLHLFAHWAPYALGVAAVAGLLLNQTAYQAGDLRFSLPALTVLEPVVAIAVGQALFGEHIASTAGARLGEVLGLAAMAIGVVGLALAEAGPSGKAQPVELSPPEAGET